MNEILQILQENIKASSWTTQEKADNLYLCELLNQKLAEYQAYDKIRLKQMSLIEKDLDDIVQDTQRQNELISYLIGKK